MTFNITYGYKIINGNIGIDENESNIVKLIFELFVEQKMHKCQIVNYLNSHNYKTRSNSKWYFGLVHKILQNEKYIGKLNYPTIVSKNIFEKSKVRLKEKENAFKNRTENHEVNVSKTNRFSNKLECYECGEAMIRRKDVAGNGIWVCRNSDCVSNCIAEKELEILIEYCVQRIINSTHIVSIKELYKKIELPQLDSYKISQDQFLMITNSNINKIINEIPNKNRTNEVLQYIDEYKDGLIEKNELEDKIIKKIHISLCKGIILTLQNNKKFIFEYVMKECF